MDYALIDVYLMTSMVVSVKGLRCPVLDVVVHGYFTNTAYMRFNKYSLACAYFPKYIISQLVGHLLGDGSLQYT